ncbi:MAG TPA: sigma-70 family RNA polymerase sigma factor [Streptosporangiaceae bacterium]|nr:sigma-70 family RNA polymerase sigma factor [Streptosporangiaceae bacterium]
MTLARADLLTAADAELLTAVRAGDSEAFSILYERHVAAARQVAYQLAASPRLADDIVAEAFARILDVVARGGGPSNAVRPYVLTAIRRVSDDRLRGGARDQHAEPAEPAALPDPGQLLVDPAFAGLETALIARAYQALPERSRAVLWHTEIEHDSPADVASLLGLTRNGVAALRRRTADDLRQAYLQMHISLITQPGCRPVAERLGAFDRRSLSARDAALVSEHLARCEGCQVVHRELADIMATVRGVIAPLVLGPAAAAYLAEARQRPGARSLAVPGSAERAGPASLSHTTTTVSPQLGPATDLLPFSDQMPQSPRAGRRALGHSSHRSRRPWRIAAAAAAGVVLAATASIALAMTLSGNNNNAPASALQMPRAPSQAAATQPPSSSPSPSARPSPSSSPHAAAPPAPAAAVVLTASLSISGHSVGHVVFQVANAGQATSGPLTAVISLPAGASLNSGNWQRSADDTNGSAEGTAIAFSGGWSCQPTSDGATCTHAALAAGQQAQGMLVITISGSGACGQAVRLTVSSGGATAGASQTLSC